MEKDIGKIPKNDTTDIVVRVDDFGDRPGVTIREFITTDRYTGFTKSGVKIYADDFPKFKEMINSVKEEDLKVEEKPAEEEQVPPGQETLKEEEAPEEERVPTGPEETAESKKAKEDLPDY